MTRRVQIGHVEAFKGRVRHWAVKLKVHPTQVRVQKMTRKWGSCSTIGWVSFAADLLDEGAAFQDFVIVHELLHLRLPNHGKLFKSLMTAYVPGWREYYGARNRATGSFEARQ